MEIRAGRRLRRTGGVSLVIVDYLQLMRADGRAENRVQQIGEMSRGLKILARAVLPGHRPVAALPRRGLAAGQAAACRTCVNPGTSSRMQTS